MNRTTRRGLLWRASGAAIAAGLTTALMAGCGGGGSAPATFTGVTLSPSTAAPSIQPLMRLYEAISIFARVASAGLTSAAYDDKLWTVGPCIFGSGSLQIALDGITATTTAALPAGTHNLAVSFQNCLVDGLVGSTLHGFAAATYTSSDFQTLSASVSATALHAALFEFRSDLYRVSADGSGSFTRARTNDGESMRFVPNADARLTNEATGRVAALGGGSYTSAYFNPPQGVAAVAREDFDDVTVTIEGTTYVLGGSLQATYGFVGNQATYVGEVRVTNQNVLVARLYGNFNGALQLEVLSPLVDF